MAAERFTAVFTGSFVGKNPGEYLYLTMSEQPGSIGGHTLRRGKPPYGDLGREAAFHELPEGCRRLVLEKYRELWDLCDGEEE